MYITSRNSISVSQFTIKATDLVFILVFIFKSLGENQWRLAGLSSFTACVSSFGNPNGVQFCCIETIASFFYHLFESLIILPRSSANLLFRLLLRCFAQLRYFLHARGGTAHDCKVLPGPAVYSLRQFFLKFLRVYACVRGLVLRVATEERRVICASQWLVELQGTIFGLRVPLHSKVLPICGYNTL